MPSGLIERSWLLRRWAVFSSLAVCDLVILYLAVFGSDSALSRDLVQSAFLTMAVLVNGYVFGGAWDDRNKDKAIIAAQAVDQSAPTTTNVTVEQ